MSNFNRPPLTIDEMIRQYNESLNQAHQERLGQLRNAFQGFTADGQHIGSQYGKLGGQGTAPRWNNIAEMNAALGAQQQARQAYKPKPIDKPTRIKQIEQELDIIRGIVPTPKGYKIDKSNIRALVKELAELKRD